MSNLRNKGLRLLAGLMALETLCGTAGAQTTQALPQAVQTAPPAAGQVRRVVVLIPPRLETTTPQNQRGVEQAAAKIMAARRKTRSRRKRRLFTLPSAARENPPPTATSVVEKTNSEPQNGRNGKTARESGRSADGAAKSGGKQTANSTIGNGKARPADTVPIEQRAALAQSLFADIVTERLPERLGVAVPTQAEVSAALNALHLTAADMEDKRKPENGRRLCQALHCQALLVPHITQCEVRDGLTRDATLYARVDIVKMPEGEAIRTNVKSEEKPETEGVSGARWPGMLDVAGAASAEHVLFHQQYQKPQGDLIRDAAQQAVNLLAHALRTGEQAPLMRPTDRLALLPVLAPTQADKLVFTRTGRRVHPSAARNLDANVSALFTPDLLPLPPDRILDAWEAVRALPFIEQTESALWKTGRNETVPDVPRIQALARRLSVNYALLAHITDVEISEGASDPSLLVADAASAPSERTVRVEAAAALVRVADGAMLWQDRATSSLSTQATPQSASGSTSTDASLSAPTDKALVHDATRFALIELQRRLRHYRAQFEK